MVVSADFTCRKTPVAVKSVDYVVCMLSDSFGVSREHQTGNGFQEKVKRLCHSWGSMRFHPKSRASRDHAPGPIIAKAAARVAAKTQAHTSLGTANMFQSSTSATIVPAIGVHNPARRRIPAPIDNMDAIIGSEEGRLISRELAEKTKAPPMTKRISNSPTPGQPRANVENSRLKRCSYRTQTSGAIVNSQELHFQNGSNTPERGLIRDSFG